VAASPRLAAPSTPGINDRVGAALPGNSFRIEPSKAVLCACARRFQMNLRGHVDCSR